MTKKRSGRRMNCPGCEHVVENDELRDLKDKLTGLPGHRTGEEIEPSFYRCSLGHGIPQKHCDDFKTR